MCMNEKREPNGHFSYPLGNVISIGIAKSQHERIYYLHVESDFHDVSFSKSIDLHSYRIRKHLYARHKAETHENRRFFSTGMEFAENAYAYVLKAPSRS